MTNKRLQIEKMENLLNSMYQNSAQRIVIESIYARERCKDFDGSRINVHRLVAEDLVSSGYGDLKAFAERLKNKSNKHELICSGALVRRDYTFTDKDINELLGEFLGE